MTTPCTRCGKQNPADIHTCTPLALRLADALLEPVVLDKHAMQAAAELRRLHEAHEWQHKMAGERLRRIGKLEAELERAVLAEREACAKVCDARALMWRVRPTPLVGYAAELKRTASVIRARGAAPQQPEGEKP